MSSYHDQLPILGLGNDIIEIERIGHCLERFKERFLERLLTHSEKAYCLKHKNLLPHLAGRFSAKESIAKALGVGISKELGWHDMEITHITKGKPLVTLSLKAKELFSDPHLILSISHSHSHVISTALWVQKTSLYSSV